MKPENLKLAQSMLSKNISIDAVAEAMSEFAVSAWGYSCQGVAYWRDEIIKEVNRGNLVA